MSAPAQTQRELLGPLLKDVSRSFYLTLRILPRRVRPQIGLAYLLARTTDTIADTEVVPVEQRVTLLRELRARISGSRQEPLELSDLVKGQGIAPERRLLERTEQSIAILNSLSPPDQQLIRAVLDTITSGQELDLQRFGRASRENVAALQSESDLDDYTYRVAGCVGEFWTKICRTHLFPRAALNEPALLEQGIRFGKGLQLVNILRDLPKDLAQGRCYLPSSQLAARGLKPEQLLSPVVEPAVRPIYNEWLDRARAHLDAGWTYTNALPWSQVRVRLACAWPVLIGLQTISLLRTNNVLDPETRIKVSRKEVGRIIRRTIILYPFPSAWKRLAN